MHSKSSGKELLEISLNNDKIIKSQKLNLYMEVSAQNQIGEVH